MEITIQHTERSFQFLANNGRDEIAIAAKPELSNDDKSFRPMELMLTSLGSCMSIDILFILQKQRQKIESFEVKVKGNRVKSPPTVFSDIELLFTVNGEVDSSKLQKAIDLSKEKYCPAFAILSKTASIKCKYQLNYGK